MAKIFRFSGYFVEAELVETEKSFGDRLVSSIVRYPDDAFQQLHVEESEEFKPNGEELENCDLALLTRHFKSEPMQEFDRPLPKAGEVYRHFKIGKFVTIIGISRHTETEEIAVVYEYEGNLWSRPLNMFMSEVDKNKYPEVSQRYRFELVTR